MSQASRSRKTLASKAVASALSGTPSQSGRFTNNSIGVAAKTEPEPEVVAVDPNSPEARLERALAAAASGDVATARQALASFPEEDERSDRARRLEGALRFLEAPLQANGKGAEGMLAAARQSLLGGDLETAMETILGAVGIDKAFRDGLPRQAMLLCFLIVGEDDERVDDYRRRLATLLY